MSPRRHELLALLGYAFEVQPADIDETPQVGEEPLPYVERMASSKRDVVVGLRSSVGPLESVVLAADTIVVVDEEILGKPANRTEAAEMLGKLSGRSHHVHTAVAVGSRSLTETIVVSTAVTFASLSATEIEWYLDRDESLDKAGGYGLQTAGGALVESISGSPSNVIGLPLRETSLLLKRAHWPRSA